MTREEAIKVLLDEWKCIDRNDGINCDRQCEKCDLVMDSAILKDAYNMAISALEQQPCEDAVSREAVKEQIYEYVISGEYCQTRGTDLLLKRIGELPPVTPSRRKGHCKDCKYFEYDSVAKVDGIPLIVAHEICNKWGEGCKTKEDGYCFLFEPQESEDKDADNN